MDGRFWDGPAARHEGGNLDVRKEQPDREKTIAARARQRAIGRELRRIYDEVVQEPVPDDVVGPTPRSQMRMRRRAGVSTPVNSM